MARNQPESINAPAVVAVVHSSGNMGKSTIARYLLADNMDGAPVFSIENVNTSAFDGVNGVEHLHAKQFRELRDQIMIHERGVVDVGSSEFSEFAKYMAQQHGSYEEFCFIVPAGGQKKQIGDTIITIKVLSAIGAKPEQIRVVFSNIDIDDSATVKSDFATLFDFHRSTESFYINPDAVIYRNEVFDLIKPLKKSLAEVVNDETDWRQKIREANKAGDIESRTYALRMLSARQLGISARNNLDDVYRSLFHDYR